LHFFFLIQKLNTKTLKSTFGEIDPARERKILWWAKASSNEIRWEREREFPARSGERNSVFDERNNVSGEIRQRRFRPERFYGERDSVHTERENTRKLNNAGDTKHKHAAGEEGYAAGDTNTLLEKNGWERCGPVETTPVKDERPVKEERERETRVGRENEKIYPSQRVLAF
jgi:hypothetical protein